MRAAVAGFAGRRLSDALVTRDRRATGFGVLTGDASAVSGAAAMPRTRAKRARNDNLLHAIQTLRETVQTIQGRVACLTQDVQELREYVREQDDRSSQHTQ